MNKRKNLLAFLIIGILGTILHFTYEWSGQNPIVGIFSAVNESVWEHQKLLFFPSVLFFLVQYLTQKEKPYNFPFASILGIVSGILTIIISFYTYTGIIGKSYAIIDILLFFIGVIVTITVKNKIINKNKFSSKKLSIFAIVLTVFLILIFGYFTFNPPQIPIFIP